MARAGVPGRHRAPALYRPARAEMITMVILALCSGLIAAAIDEAGRAGDRGWQIVFIVFGLADVALYLHCSWHWWRYPDRGTH